MRNLFVFLFLSSIVISTFAGGLDFGANDRFQKSLSLLSDLQSPYSCLKGPKFSGQCSETLVKLVKDDLEDRLIVFDSMAPICQSRIENMRKSKTKGIHDFSNPELLQKAFETNMTEYLGEYSNETAKNCMLSKATSNNDVISKFYYYSVRLNETAGKISQEQAIVERYLGKKSKVECPNEYLLNAANQVCQSALACTNQESLDQLSIRVHSEEELYIQSIATLSKLPNDCAKDDNCQKQKAAVSAVIAGLLGKNPWFLNSDFKSQRLKNSTKSRLEKYFKVAKENLAKQQKLLQKAAMCIHNSNKSECDIDEIRETLSLTQDIPDRTGGRSDSEKILNEYMGYQSCLEDGSLARNRASGIVGDAFKNAGLGLIALPIGARWAAAKAGKMVLAEVTALVGADVAINVLSSRDSWKGMADKCFSADQMSFQYKRLSAKNICESPSSSLSQSSQDSSGCLVDAGLSALSALPFAGVGYNLVRYAQSIGVMKSSVTASTTVVKESVQVTNSTAQSVQNLEDGAEKVVEKAGDKATSKATDVAHGPENTRRTSDVVPMIERRQANSVRNISCALECRSEKVVDITAIPELPKTMRIIEGEKIDGTKALYYKHIEKLEDGSSIATVREFQIDEVTGGINANYPAGRELFNKIAKEKAGKAYFAFFDVGSLGFVNKEFKAGEAAGDRYLKGVADKIREVGGNKVTLARTGGDEFGLIIDEVDPVKAKELVVKIQEAIRKDLKGDAKQIFREEKIVRANEYKAALVKLEAEYPDGVPADQKAALLEKIQDLAKVQQPDVSIGLAQIGHDDVMSDLSKLAEEQAKQMKIKTALEFGRSAKKYGSKDAPNARPKPMYVAPVADALPSTSWKPSTSSGRSAATDIASVDSLPIMQMEPKDEILRFSNMSVVRFEDQLGRSIYKTERFITDAKGNRVPVISEIPTRGATGLLDGTHSEGQKLITSFIESQPNSFFVMPKLRSLKYLNYFESGTQAGDSILEAVAEVIKKNTRPYDLNFKLGGADFLMGVKNKSVKEMTEFYKKVSEQVASHPKVKQALAEEATALAAKLDKAKAANDIELVTEVQQRIQDLQHFNLDLQFQVV